LSRIALLCATERGVRVLMRLRELLPKADLAVVTFRETPWEPPFRDRIEAAATEARAAFEECAQIERSQTVSTWRSSPPDLLLCVSWRYLVPREVYQQVTHGAFVFHDSLLPRYRGFSPTVWAMLNGEERTGATLFAMTEEVDAGDIAAQKEVPIGDHDNIADVMERVTCAYLDLLEENIAALLTGTAPLRPQGHSEATYTCRLLPEDVRIDWSMPSSQIYNLIRGYSWPYPGAYTFLNRRKLHIHEARPIHASHDYVGRIPGRVVSTHDGIVTVLTGDGAIGLSTVCYEDGLPLPAREAIQGSGYTLGS
jgi:methionyl-tRNA formyltransferase